MNLRKASEEKLLVSEGGINVSISMIEPVLFLQGFGQKYICEPSDIVLRGSLHLLVRTPAKIKAVSLAFHGKAVTKWPRGIPPGNSAYEEARTILSHEWAVFSAQCFAEAARVSTDQVEPCKHVPGSVSFGQGLIRSSSNTSSKGLGSKQRNRLLQYLSSSWDLLKGDFLKYSLFTNARSAIRPAYQTFDAGEYVYNFEYPLHKYLPETINLELGSVKYGLEVRIERAGAFCGNLVGTKEVTLIRTPAETSLERTEPIVFDRIWRNEVHVNIMVFGRSFPLGAQIPISIRLTPLVTLQFHWIKVFVTEHVEYLSSNNRAHRMEPVRKIQLFEKSVDVPLPNTISKSTVRTAQSGVLIPGEDSAAPDMQKQEPLENLGSLGEGVTIGRTEMQILVQLPSHGKLKENKDKSSRLHFDTTYWHIRVHHWIKTVIRLSQPDPNHSLERKYTEVHIDSPLRILSHQVTEANTTLPVYSSSKPVAASLLPENESTGGVAVRCGAAPFPVVPISNTLFGSRENLGAARTSARRANLQQSHISGSENSSSLGSAHLFGVPSSYPPAYEDEATWI